MPNDGNAGAAERREVLVFSSPHWVAIFFAIAVPASLVPFYIGFLLGLSVAHDVVFGVYALLSGVFADFVIRMGFKRLLVVFRKPRIPFLALWIVLCIYIMVFTPFE